MHVCASCDKGTALCVQGQLPMLTRAHIRVGPSPVAFPGSWQKLQSAYLNPGFGLRVGMSQSSVQSNDVFCSHRNQCTLKGERQKETEESRKMRQSRSVRCE